MLIGVHRGNHCHLKSFTVEFINIIHPVIIQTGNTNHQTHDSFTNVEANCNESEAESESIFHYSKTALLYNTQGSFNSGF